MEKPILSLEHVRIHTATEIHEALMQNAATIRDHVQDNPPEHDGQFPHDTVPLTSMHHFQK